MAERVTTAEARNSDARGRNACGPVATAPVLGNMGQRVPTTANGMPCIPRCPVRACSRAHRCFPLARQQGGKCVSASGPIAGAASKKLVTLSSRSAQMRCMTAIVPVRERIGVAPDLRLFSRDLRVNATRIWTTLEPNGAGRVRKGPIPPLVQSYCAASCKLVSALG